MIWTLCFIGSMQENIFSSNEFVVEAESFGRVSQRFKIVTISKEDIKMYFQEGL